jgi:hypothetical protein
LNAPDLSFHLDLLLHFCDVFFKVFIPLELAFDILDILLEFNLAIVGLLKLLSEVIQLCPEGTPLMPQVI